MKEKVLKLVRDYRKKYPNLTEWDAVNFVYGYIQPYEKADFHTVIGAIREAFGYKPIEDLMKEKDR